MTLKHSHFGQPCCTVMNNRIKAFLFLTGMSLMTFYQLKSQTASTPTKELMRIRVDSENNSDQAVVYLTENATSGFDSKYDAYKLSNPILNLFTTSSDQQNLSINGISHKITEERIPLCFKSREPGKHHFKVMDYTNPGLFADIYIHDNYQNITIPLILGTEFNIVVSTQDSGKLISDRFVIILRGTSVVTSLKDHISEEYVDIYPNPISGTTQLNLHLSDLKSDFINVKIKTIEGKEIRTHRLSSSHHVVVGIEHLVAGIYWVEIKNADGSSFHKKFIKE